MAARKGGLFFGQSEVSVDNFLGRGHFLFLPPNRYHAIVIPIYLCIHLIHATDLDWSNRLRTLAFGVCE